MRNREDILIASRRLLAAAALFFCFVLPSPSFAADPDPSNDEDSLTIRINPVVDMGVEIDTAAVTLDFVGALGTTFYTLTPTTVTIVGNVQPQELDLSAQALDTWTLDADEAVGTNELQLYGLFASGRQSPPSEAEFAGVKNLITGSPKRAGTSPGVGADGGFENDSMSGAADMDNILLTAPQRQLWLRMDTPAWSTADAEQRFTITINATRTDL